MAAEDQITATQGRLFHPEKKSQGNHGMAEEDQITTTPGRLFHPETKSLKGIMEWPKKIK